LSSLRRIIDIRTAYTIQLSSAARSESSKQRGFGDRRIAISCAAESLRLGEDTTKAKGRDNPAPDTNGEQAMAIRLRRDNSTWHRVRDDNQIYAGIARALDDDDRTLNMQREEPDTGE
jgi:hypothetical protein